MGLFPFFGDTAPPQGSQELPLYREAAWDFENNTPRMENGDFIFVTGNEAIKTWCYKALKTERFRYIIYSWSFGTELDSLIGRSYSPSLTKAEAMRYVEESLCINPYIRGIYNAAVSFQNGMLTFAGDIETVYGMVSLEVTA